METITTVNVDATLEEYFIDLVVTKNEEAFQDLLNQGPKIVVGIGKLFDLMNDDCKLFVSESLTNYYGDNRHVMFLMRATNDVDVGIVEFIKNSTYVMVDAKTEKTMTDAINAVNGDPKKAMVVREVIQEFYKDGLLKILEYYFGLCTQ